MSKWTVQTTPGIGVTHAAFSSDNKLVVAGSNNECCVYNVITGKRVAIARMEGKVMGVVFSGVDKFLCVLSTGEAKEWSVVGTEVVLLRSTRITAYPVKYVVNNVLTGKLFVVLEQREAYFIFSLSLVDLSLTRLGRCPTSSDPRHVAVAEHFIAFCHGKIVEVKPYETDERKKEGKYENTTKLQNYTKEENERNQFVSICASNNTVAAALAMGRVYVWHNVYPQFELGHTQSVHWHHTPPDIALSPFGGLLSVGQECVLVKFPPAKGNPSFLSSFSSPLKRIFTNSDASFVSLLGEDNSLSIVQTSSMTVISQTEGVLRSETALKSVWLSDPAHPRYIIMNGRPGWLQWFDMVSLTTKYTSHISLENITASDTQFAVVSSVNYFDVIGAAIGRNLACTLEKRVNWEFDTYRIRFWSRNPLESTSPLSLLDSYEAPNDVVTVKGCINALTHQDKCFVCITEKSQFIVYAPYAENGRYSRDPTRTASWQNSLFRCATDILPGGLMVSAHEGVNGDSVVLWDVVKMKVVEVISSDSAVVDLQWADSSTLLFSTEKSVSAFDISSLSIRWKVEESLPIRCVGGMPLAISANQVFSFCGSSGRVLDTIPFPSPLKDVVCHSSTQPHPSTVIVGLSNEYEIVSATCSSSEDAPMDDSSVHVTPFSQLTSDGQSRDESLRYRPRRVSRAKPVTVLDGPVHSLPPLNHIAPLFISSCLLPSPQPV